MTIESIARYLRGIAIIGVFVENYLSWIGINSTSTELVLFNRYVQLFGASLVHIFFILSGYGLVKKYLEYVEFPWKKYAANRFATIVVPYWVVVLATYVFINMLNGIDSDTFGDKYRLSDVLSYLLFLRNFNRSCWDLNPTLWFMQAIFALYIAFPFLLSLLKKNGLKSLFICSAGLAYASRAACIALGYQIDRGSGVSFLFYLLEFVIGMALAAKPKIRSANLSTASMSAWCLLIAFVGYTISFILKNKIEIPFNLHDVFTCVGSFALGIFSYQVVAFLKLEKVARVITSVGKLAFVIYLLHAPPIQHFIKPLLKRYYENSQGIFEVGAILIVYFSIVVLVAKPLARYFRNMSSKIEAFLLKPV
jgi:peptidoglycan/LPS O-acetylase OafA/YrhL